MNRIKNISLCFRVLFQIILVALPVLLVISWVFAPEPVVLLAGFIKLDAIPASYSWLHTYSAQAGAEPAILHSLTLGEKIIGCLVSAIPMLIAMFVTYSLIILFRLYEQGSIFSLKHVKTIRKIGYALLLGQVIEPVYQFTMGFVLTRNNPLGHRYAAIGLDQTNIGIVLIALLTILIAWIMAEGYKLQQEQQLTV